MEGRVIARVPGLAQPWGGEVPIGADLAGDVAQVVPVEALVRAGSLCGRGFLLWGWQGIAKAHA
jgi:hypothetical protein